LTPGSSSKRATAGALASEVFRATEAGIDDFLPRERWNDYMRAVVPAEAKKATTERKTGVKRAEVITARRVEDERGWLRLAG
jgi:hypothetical protein